MKKSCFGIAVLLVGLVVPCLGADSIFENFNGATISPLLNFPGNYVYGANATPVGTTQSTTGRQYITTVATDYNTVNFVFEADFKMGGNSGAGLFFMGIGSGQPDPTFFDEPAVAAYLRPWPSPENVVLSVSSGIGVSRSNSETPFGPTPSDGILAHAKIVKSGDIITFSYQSNYDGSSYTPEASISLSISSNLSFLNSNNSNLFIGADAPVVIDNMSVSVPEPSVRACSLLGLGVLAAARRARRSALTST